MVETNQSKILEWAEKLLILLSILVVPLICFFEINRSFWLDEAYSYSLAINNGFIEIINAVKNTAGPPFYYFLLSIWMKIFGISEIAIRSLSIFFYLLSLPAIFYLGKITCKDNRSSVVCTFLFMFSPIAYGHSQNARMYSMLAFLTILSSIFFFKLVLDNPNSKKDLILLTFIHIIGTFTHFWYFFIFFAQAIIYCVLFFKKEHKSIRIVFLLSTIPFWILWGPILPLQATLDDVSWMKSPKIYDLADTVIGFYGLINPLDVGIYGITDWSRGLLIYIGFIVIILVKIENNKLQLQYVQQIKDFIFEKFNLAFLILFFVSLLTPFAISQIKPLYVSHRYTIIALVPCVMFFGALISKFGNRLLILTFGYLLLTISVLTIINPTIESVSITHSDKEAAQYLIRETKNKDVIIFTGWSLLSIDYYFTLFKLDKDLIKISYTPLNKDIKDKLTLKAQFQTNEIITKLRNLPTDESTKIWVLYDADTEPNKILRDQLDRNFSMIRIVNLKGPFFDGILVYKAKQNTIN